MPASPMLPLGYAEWVAQSLCSEGGATKSQASRWRAALRGFQERRRVSRILRRFEELSGVQLAWPRMEAARPRLFPSDDAAGEDERTPSFEEALILEALEGRSMLGDEVKQALKELGHVVAQPIDCYLDEWVQAKRIERVAAVGWDEAAGPFGTWRCRRCLSDQISLVPCIYCRCERCPQCASCGSLGRSSACAGLYHRPIADKVRRGGSGQVRFALGDGGERRGETATHVEVRLPFSLSPRQAQISDALRRSSADALIWAACGAGKTEVTYGAIEDVLRRGGRALFSVPRRDVVQQLGERLRSVFHGVEIVALHGGTPLKYARSELVVATAHQAVRFRACFDVLVIDEVDAFPLSSEPWLRTALDRTLRPGGRRIIMTATPPESLKIWAKIEGIETHVLPKRPHGRPLPAPEIVTWGRKDSERLAAMRRFLGSSLARGRRVILFVPTVPKGYDLLERLSNLGLGRVAYIHGSDARRSEKLKDAELGKIDVLISTTVLERGITIPKVDVAVADADDERVFDAAALIQMAGRSGRKMDDPTGDVVFFAGTTTPAMRLAVNTINQLNSIAAQSGSRGSSAIPCRTC